MAGNRDVGMLAETDERRKTKDERQTKDERRETKDDRRKARGGKDGARAEDPRLQRITKICLALSKTTRELHGEHATFLAGKKVFAYFLNNHHGDGIVSIACKALPGDNTFLAAANPDRFYLPAYIGPRGWVALRLDVGETDWDEVAELVEGSYGQTKGGRRKAKDERRKA